MLGLRRRAQPNNHCRSCHGFIGVYIASIPFFIALYQAFKVLEHVRNNRAFSPATVKALRTIKYYAIAIVGFVAVSAIFIMFADKDDRGGRGFS